MSNRIERANEQIMKCLATIIQNMNDPRLQESMITVSDVNISVDFSFCKVLVSILSEDNIKKQNILKLLKKSSGYIKRQLSLQLDMPHIPELKFMIDNGYEHTKKINSILETLNIPEEDDDEIN